MKEQEEFDEVLEELNEELDKIKVEMKRLQLVHQYKVYKLIEKRVTDS